MDLSDDLIKKFMLVDRLHHMCTDAAVKSLGSGLHRNQQGMLLFLDMHPDLSQKEIAAHFDISAAAVTNTLKVLEKNGFIKRRTDLDDTRKNRIEITEKGRKVLDETKHAFSSVDDVMIKGIPEEDRHHLSKCLDIMEENLKRAIDETNRVREEKK